MRALPTAFTLGMWHYTQVSRVGDVAIYHQRDTAATVECYEVILVQSPGGNETYPHWSQWGKAGWTHLTLEDAQAQATTLGHEQVGQG